jgi:hypothetical protein
MGFRLKRTFKLRWGGDLAGLEIDTRSASVETAEEVRALVFQRRDGAEGGESRLVEIIVAHIVNWNFEDEDGQILPVNAASLNAQEPALLREIAKEWYLAIAGISAPLDLGSTGPESSAPELSIPMETP